MKYQIKNIILVLLIVVSLCCFKFIQYNKEDLYMAKISDNKEDLDMDKIKNIETEISKESNKLSMGLIISHLLKQIKIENIVNEKISDTFTNNEYNHTYNERRVSTSNVKIVNTDLKIELFLDKIEGMAFNLIKFNDIKMELLGNNVVAKITFFINNLTTKGKIKIYPQNSILKIVKKNFIFEPLIKVRRFSFNLFLDIEALNQGTEEALLAIKLFQIQLIDVVTDLSLLRIPEGSPLYHDNQNTDDVTNKLQQFIGCKDECSRGLLNNIILSQKKKLEDFAIGIINPELENIIKNIINQKLKDLDLRNMNLNNFNLNNDCD